MALLTTLNHVSLKQTPVGSKVRVSREFKVCGGVFEQLARYTTRYQQSDLHFGLYSS